MAPEVKRLYRSRTNKVIAGVCGGLGEYFSIDPTIVRIAFALFALVWGAGIILYLFMMVVTPLEGKEEDAPSLGNRVKGAAEEITATAKQFAKDVKPRGGASSSKKK